MILDGELDHLPEAAFNLKGTIEEGLAKNQLKQSNITSLTSMGEAVNELKSGQVDAIKLAISKALTLEFPDLRPVLKKAGLIKRDPREKERKKYGLRSARKREQFSKR